MCLWEFFSCSARLKRAKAAYQADLEEARRRYSRLLADMRTAFSQTKTDLTTCEGRLASTQSRLKEAESSLVRAFAEIAELKQAMDSLVIPPPKDIRVFASTDIHALLMAEKLCKEFLWEPEDAKYSICSWTDWDIFIKHDNTNKFKYIAEVLDCDDFANIYAARAIEHGRKCLRIWGVTERFEVGHMWNGLLGHDSGVLSLRHFEPQNDHFWVPKDKPWLLYRAYG